MAKVGYIFKADLYEGFDADKEWMQQYGCIQIVEESVEHESLRPQWKQLISKLERGDEIVVPKFSNAVRGSRELASFIEFCRIKVVRIISIHDRIDSMGKMFPETTAVDVLNMLGGLAEEVTVLRNSSAHAMQLQQNIRTPIKTAKVMEQKDRENTIVDMYNNGHSIDSILAVSGYNSRSSVFRILNKYKVNLNRASSAALWEKEKRKGITVSRKSSRTNRCVSAPCRGMRSIYLFM